MNPDIFFKNFELLAEAPNGIKKLRELILQLAVQGKLVEQNAEDGPASVLLEKIEAEKERLVKEGKIRKSKKIQEINPEEIPYSIPTSWIWTRLIDVYDVRDGTHDSPKYLEEGIPLVTSKNLSDGFLNLTNVKYISEDDHSKISERSKVEKNDILFAMIGSIGNPAIVNVDSKFSIKNVALLKYYSLENSVPKYLNLFLRFASKHMRKQAAGGVQSFVSLGYLRKYTFPLPPLAEQKRIVSKVDELMALCDELETRRQKKQELRAKLNGAALDKMLNAESQEKFEESWQRICKNFDILYDNPENVKKLRQAILQLAVQGKIVEQNGEDEPASVLLEKIKEEKKRLIREQKIKKIKVLPVENGKLPFELPCGWEFSRLGEITKKLGAGSTPKGGKSVYLESGIKFIRSQNVWNNGLKLENIACIPSEIHERMNGTFVEPGDILLNITGASIGRSSIVPHDFDEGNVSQHVAIVRSIDREIREYLHLCIISPYIKDLIMSEQVGISREGLSMTRLKEFLIPIPPLEEQKRIVKKVEQLSTLCDALELKLKKSQKDSGQLMESVVQNLLAEAAE